ncbi:hypothetical protein LguiB_009376 [Lonicera macranthoides]
MGTAKFLRFSVLILWLLFFLSSSTCSSIISAHQELSLVVAQSTKLQLSPSLLVEKSPGIKPGDKVVCERVQVHGLPRLKNLRKFAHSVKVKISYVNSSARPPNVEVCFHRNASLGIGMCSQEKWEKLTKGLWVRSMSPFDHKILDIRMAGSSSGTLEVSLDEDFFMYRVIFLVLGFAMMTLASSLSQSLVFYYSSAMAVGVALVILLILFQGMKLLPTGRKNSLAIFFYSSMIGMGSFLLSYVPRLLRSILVEIGIAEDMYNPLAVFLMAFLVLAGAWLGFWVVRKLVLTEDGSIDVGVSHFVTWSIRIIASVMILQSTVDPLLAAEALLCVIWASSLLRRISRPRFIRHLYKKLWKTDKSSSRRSRNPKSSPIEDSYDEYMVRSPKTPKFPRPQFRPFSRNSLRYCLLWDVTPMCTLSAVTAVTPGSTRTPTSQLSDSETFYSSFHNTPERRKLSKGEWEKFTRDSTKKALEGLVSSPDFAKWAVAHADRITLTPSSDTAARPRRRWVPWF